MALLCALSLWGAPSVAQAFCGNAGQRACCAGENGYVLGGCSPNVVTVPQDRAGLCSGFNPFGIQASAICVAPTPCGGAGQRACCAGEGGFAFGGCGGGLNQVPNANSGYCTNSVLGIQSNGICVSITPCGGAGQRACCLGEAGFGACQAGLVQLPQPNSGQCSNLLPGIQSSGICAAVTPCGGANQRACCFGEAGFGACLAGLNQVPQPNSGQCGNLAPGIQSGGVCVAATPCGGIGQRACCAGEAGFGACQAGLVQLPQPNSGQCSNLLPGIQSSGVCAAVTPCGGANQRACCFGEAGFGACLAGLNQVPQASSGQCGNLAPGIQSGGVCVPVTACGGADQRACCFGEAGFGACQGGLAEVPQANSGQCSNFLPGIQSSGICKVVLPCGGAGERSCCAGETGFGACRSGLAEVPLPNAGQCGNSAPGIQSSGTCVPITACGGKGQRACCVGEGAACAQGLIEAPGCSGDCACGGGLASSGMCTTIEPIAEPGTQWTPPPGGAAPPPGGYADLHLHLFADLAHGGGVFSGKAFSPGGGVNEALAQDYGTNAKLVDKDGKPLAKPTCPSFLPDCGAGLFHGDHNILGAGSDQVGAGTKDGGDRFGFGAESNLGAPLFNGWPVWTSTTHQQAYHRWLERAWRGGLRLVAMLAVTNEALCRTNKRVPGTDCDDGMSAIRAQLAAARDFEKFVDGLFGGPGKGYFRIVTSPAQAREVIAGGKMAVVLGIEMDNLFNCDFDERDPKTGACTEDSVRRFVDDVYATGVRHLFPVHNFDNAFGSPATWQDAIHVGNRGVEGKWWDAEDCPGEGYGFKLNDGLFTSLFNLLMSLFGFGLAEVPAPHDGDASCNALGLAPLGHVLIDQMMRRGMILDVDHMSSRAIDETLRIAEAMNPPYPVVASHVQFFDLNVEEIRHERMRTREQLERIRNVGGMVAAMLKDDQQDTDNIGRKYNVPYGRVDDDCRHSSKTWAQAYRYAVDVMGGPVAFGSDFNGVAGHLGPRFGSDACGGDPGLTAPEFEDRLRERHRQWSASSPLAYPFSLPGFGSFDRQVTGQKTFDYNFDGLAHAGLLPDLVADLGVVGLTPADLDPLFRSAEGFVAVWERALASGCPAGAGQDADGDGVGDGCDLCTAVPDPFQRDADGDGFGNLCDADLNDDGIVNFADLARMRSVFFGTDPVADLNGDGIVNFSDLALLRKSFFRPPGPSALRR